MTIYYEIMWGNHPIQLVEKWEAGNFDILSFWESIPFNGIIPKEVRLYIPSNVETYPKPDILPNPASWLIISDHLLEIWKPFMGDDVQVFDAPVFYESDKRRCDGYHIINPLRIVDAIDWERSKVHRRKDGTLSLITDMIIKKTDIGQTHIFRLKGYMSPIIVSPAMVKDLKRKKCKGLAFLKVRAM